jgi:predicted RNA-binding Zn ribbon-like protein
VLWPLALSAESVFGSDDVDRLRQCGGTACGWLFLDATRNHSRHWCDMADCGNRAKVRRFRARARQDGRRPG